uniref:Uncharacterized protein n=1 Tax=Magallana gigas TaxID=29159 RepID=A0A8W8K2X6_MAGGI
MRKTKAPSESDFTEEEEDELASYLAQAFPELRSLERHDPASLIRDTIKFVINTTTKAKTDTMLNEQSTIENVFEWLLGKGISKETSQIFKVIQAVGSHSQNFQAFDAIIIENMQSKKI